MIRGIIAKLIATTGVTDLVNPNKIYPVIARQNEKRPYITIRRTSVTTAIVKDIASGVDETLFNVAVYTDEYKEAVDILNAVRASIDNMTATSEGVAFKRVWYQSSQDLYDKEDGTFVIVDTYAARFGRAV